MREVRGGRDIDGTERSVALRLRDGVLSGDVDGVAVEAGDVVVRGDVVLLRVGDRRLRAVVARDGDRTLVHVAGRVFTVTDPEVQARRGAAHRHQEDESRAVSPMTGTVATVDVAEGDAVKKGATLAVVEAMKMQFVVRAPRDLTVGPVRVAPGQSVDIGAVLVEFA